MKGKEGMTDWWLTANDIAQLLSYKDKRPANIRAKKEGWPYRNYKARGGKERRYHLANLPEDIQRAYAAGRNITLDQLKAELLSGLKPESPPDPAVKPWEKLHETDRETARLREKVILSWRGSGLTQLDFVAAYSAGHILPDTRSRIGDTLTDSTLSRWFRCYEKSGLPGLAPRYDHRRGGHGASLDPAIKGLIRFHYLNRNRYSLRSVQRKLEEKENVRVNYTMLCRYVRCEISAEIRDYFRRGEKYFNDHYQPYLERDYTQYYSMQVAVADHKTFDFVSRVKRGDEWHIVRLSLTCITDMRSRKILGWHIDEVPSTLTIIRATKMMAEQYGCPEAFLVDNGKDFSSYWFAGDSWNEQHRKAGKRDKGEISSITGDMGTAVQFCTPYRGQSKPIERFFGFLSGEHDKAFKSYTGSNTANRIDELKLYWGSFDGKKKIPIEELPTIEEVRAIFAEFVKWYNTKWRHGGRGMDHKTPDTVFAENRRERRDIPEEYRKYVWTRREVCTVQRNGVEAGGGWYFNEEMGLIVGQKVELRISIDDIGTGYIFDLKTGSYMYDADYNLLKDSGVKEENVRRLNRLRRAQRQRLRKEREDLNEIGKDRKTRLEELRDEEAGQTALKAAGGEDMAADASPGLTLVTPEAGPQKKRKGLFGEVLRGR
ncbi:MAG: DDE-type integrase/transposase/recombinase [Treponema sp.]|jgi:transposase InsO family protein|nr:DDE-type integrase/transposase/recombinase [Treponema sp.]